MEALRDVSIDAGRAEFVSIIGPSGCGKTTLLRVIGGLLEPSAGHASFDGMTPAEMRRRKRVGFVFQDPALLAWRTAQGNARLGLELMGGAPRGDMDAAAARALDAVGLGGFGAYYPRELSGGMRQRVALARALAMEPDALLMDEPFGALDEITRREMRYELVALWERRRATALLVTHSIAEAALLSDRVIVMSGRPGRVVADIPVPLDRPRLEAVERTSAFLDIAYRIRDALSLGASAGAA